MTEQTPTAPATFSTDTALLWVQLADETPEGQTFPVVPEELLLLLSTFLETRTALLRTQVRLRSLTSLAQNAINTINEQRVMIDDMRAALPADWVPARIRNEEDAAATAPQDVANDAPQGDPGDESPSIPAVEAAE
jgi:hypothetical protein